MAQITAINSYNANIIHREIDAALKAIAEKYEMQYIKSKTLNFDAAGFKVSIEGKVKTLGENGLTSTAAANSAGAQYLKMQGMEMNALAFVQNEVYRVIGYDTKRPKYSVLLLNVRTGKTANGSVNTVKAGINAYKVKFPAQATQG